MPSSGYTAISFTAGEQPTTAKWNLVGSNDASFNTMTGMNDAVLKYRHFANDSSYIWQSWTPTFTGITVGNGTVVAGYQQIGKTVDYRVLLTFGTTTTLPTSADSFISLPVTARSGIYSNLSPIGMLSMLSGSYYQGYAGFSDVNTLLLLAYKVAGGAIQTQAVDTNNMGAPGSSGVLFVTGAYEAV